MTPSNLEKYKKDIDNLIEEGNKLLITLGQEGDIEYFSKNYEIWYSESLALIKVVLPDRLNDFERSYNQRDQTSIRYCITSSSLPIYQEYTFQSAVILFTNQLSILKSAKRKFESSLFDIRRLVQADLFDSELDAARELNEKGFTRGAGAIAGVVLEGHVLEVCKKHNVEIKNKNPSINDYNDQLKNESVIEIFDWRFIQRLADLRNLCDHNKKEDPTKDKIKELIEGVERVIKTIF